MRTHYQWGKKNNNTAQNPPAHTLRAPGSTQAANTPNNAKDTKEQQQKQRTKIMIGGGIIIALWGIYAITSSSLHGNDDAATPQYNTLLQWSTKNVEGIYIPKDSKGVPEHYELTNLSSDPIDVKDAFTLDDDTPDKIINSHCPHPLLPGNYCSLDLLFNPRKDPGKWVQHLHNKGGIVSPLTLSGSYITRTGSFKITQPPMSKMTTAAFPGPVAYASLINISDSEQPTQPMRFLDPKGAFGISDNECPSILNSGDSCEVGIRIVRRPPPKEDEDTSKHTLKVEDILQVGDTNVTIAGRINSYILNINHVTNNGHIDIIMKNNGNASINTMDARVDGPGFGIEMNNCKPEIVPQKTCIISVSAPYSGTGTFMVAGQKILLSGFGTDARWSKIDPIHINKPNKVPYTTEPFTVDLTNNGPGDVQDPYNNILLDGTDFTIKDNDCPKGLDQKLTPDSHCTVTLVATAHKDGPLHGTLTLRNGPRLELTGSATGFQPKFTLSGERMWTNRGVILFQNNGNFTIDKPMDMLTLYRNPSDAFHIEGCQDPVKPKEECGIILTRDNPVIQTARLDIIPIDRSYGNIFTNFMAMGHPHITSDIEHTVLEVPNTLDQDTDHAFVISNSGQGIDRPEISLEGEKTLLSIGESDCTDTLFPGDSCTIHLHLHAGKATPGEVDSLHIKGKDNEHIIHITVKDLAAPKPTWVTSSLFVSKTGTVYGQINVLNHGRMPYAIPPINSWFIDGPDTSDVRITAVDCTDGYAQPGAICTYTMRGNTAPGKPLSLMAHTKNIILSIHTMDPHYTQKPSATAPSTHTDTPTHTTPAPSTPSVGAVTGIHG